MSLGRAEHKYRRVEAALREMVEALPEGYRLPGERSLAVSHNCNFLTVRKALKKLVDDRTIVRRLGSGTFVAKHPADDRPGASSKAGGIGVLIHRQGSAYAYRILEALAQASIDQEVELRPVWIRSFDDIALAQVGMLKKEQCSAMVLPWIPSGAIERVRNFVLSCPVPISLPLIIPGLEENCFEHQEIFGISNTTVIAEEICRFCRLLGHERIAFLGPDSPDDPVLQKKISGYVHFISRENLSTLCAFVPRGAEAMDHLAQQWKSFRKNLAVICHDDQHALRFMTAMHKIGFRAPDDFCIVGQHDTEASRYSDPPLSTSRDNFDYIAHWLLKNARALADGGVCQSTEMPRLPFYVRGTWGGLARITNAFRAQFKTIDIILDDDVPAGENGSGAQPVKTHPFSALGTS